jgi:pre-mRNA 3'-end-processing factor FIP1
MTDYTPLERGAPVPARPVQQASSTAAGQPQGQGLGQTQSQPILGEHTAETDPTGPPVAPLDPTSTTQIVVPESDLPVPHAPSTHPAVPDPESFALKPPTLPNGKNIYEYDLAVMKSTGQPWRRPGSDLSKWFNYGFDEDSWSRYLGWRQGMTSGVEAVKGMKPGETLQDDVADLLRVPRAVPGMENQGGATPGNNDSSNNNANNNDANQANNMAMMGMGMGMGMPDGMQMSMPDMFNQMNQMGMDPAAMMGMPMMQGMQGMQGGGMDFAQMAGMMNNMFGAGGQPQQQQQQQQQQPQQQQHQVQQGGLGTPGQGGETVKQEEGDVKTEGTPQNQGDSNVRLSSTCIRCV